MVCLFLYSATECDHETYYCEHCATEHSKMNRAAYSLIEGTEPGSALYV